MHSSVNRCLQLNYTYLYLGLHLGTPVPKKIKITCDKETQIEVPLRLCLVTRRNRCELLSQGPLRKHRCPLCALEEKAKRRKKEAFSNPSLLRVEMQSVARKLMTGEKTLKIESSKEKPLVQTCKLLSKANSKVKGINSEQTS